MKKRVASFLLIAAFSFVCRSKGPAAQEGAKDRIEKAAAIFVGPPDPSITKEKILSALFELLDISASLTPDNEYKEDIVYRIGVAKDLIKDDSLFNDKARQYLSFAYRMMTNGKKFEPPKELDEFVTPAEHQEKALKYIKGMIAAALESLDAGDNQETARLLLEMVLMTVTPVRG